jgi:protein-tyrosine sulfotransferase
MGSGSSILKADVDSFLKSYRSAPMKHSPIFILGCHRSGTSLLRSMLDGHPDLNVVPIESHYFEHSGYRVAYPLRFQEKDPDRDPSAFISSAKTALESYDHPTSLSADVQASGIFDVPAFQERMKAGGQEDGPERMEIYFRALLEAAGLSVQEEGAWVEKSVEHFEFLPLLKRWFPSARFVHILRNPYANMVSLRNFRSRRGNFPFLPPLVDTLRWHRYHWQRWDEWMDEHFTVRYEDFLEDPERQMKSLMEHLGLPFDPVLLKPSFLGREWKGNRSSGEGLKGVSADRKDAWKEEITPVELRLVNRGLYDLIGATGYDTVPTPKGYWKKRSGEPWKTYLSNRIYKNYLGKGD